MSDYVLVVASSARLLARAAARCGLKPLAIDLYADLDTQGHAVCHRKIPSLAWAHLAPAVAFFKARYPVSLAVYGSGFEEHPGSLRQLAACLPLTGNPPEVFARLNDKAAFFSALSRLNIPFPETRFTAPPDGDWLVKPKQGQGGLGIKRHRDGVDHYRDDCYWQSYQAGVPHSALFLADGEKARVVGFNRQWTAGLVDGQDFVFSGIINHAEISEALQLQIKGWLAALVAEFSLRGLNSLDFILADGCAYVLEINPRVSASMQLYDGDLLRRHIEASLESLALGLEPVCKAYRAYQIVYAPEDIRIPEKFIWPDGCMDLPVSGVRCRKDQPICSIIAHHSRPDVVLRQLERLRQTLFNSLQIGNNHHGIPSQR